MRKKREAEIPRGPIEPLSRLGVLLDTARLEHRRTGEAIRAIEDDEMDSIRRLREAVRRQYSRHVEGELPKLRRRRDLPDEPR